MKRNVSLSIVTLLMLALLCSSAALADSSISRERVRIQNLSVPLVEAPATLIEAEAQADRSGGAAVTVASSDLLAAVNTVNEEGTVRITVTAEGAGDSVTAEYPGDALQTVVDQTSAELSLDTAAGQVTLPHAVLASVVEAAEGGNVIIAVSTQASARTLLDGRADVDAAQIAAGSAIEVSIASGSTAVTELDGGLATVSVPVGGGFQEGMSYHVYRAGASGGVQTLVGRCVMADGQLRVELESGSLGAFVAVPDAVGEAVTASPNMVLSPLAGDAETPTLFVSVRQWCDTAVKQLLQAFGL